LFSFSLFLILALTKENKQTNKKKKQQQQQQLTNSFFFEIESLLNSSLNAQPQQFEDYYKQKATSKLTH